MKVQISLEKMLFAFILYYHVINLFAATFIADSSTKVIELFLIVLYIYFIKKGRNIKEFIAVNAFILFYVAYNTINYHIYQITHADFYTFVLLGLIFVVYGNEKFVYKFYTYLTKKQKQYFVSEIIFFAILFFSMLFKQGLRVGFGATLPVL